VSHFVYSTAMSNLDPQQFLNATEQVAYNAVRDAISHLEEFDLPREPAPRGQPCISAATIGDVRWIKARSLLVSCRACACEEVLSFEGLADSVRLSWIANCFVCKSCGHNAAYVLPTWHAKTHAVAERTGSISDETASKADTPRGASFIFLETQELRTEGWASRVRQVLNFIAAKTLAERLWALLTHLQIIIVTAVWQKRHVSE
jgi:hypothetical protein